VRPAYLGAEANVEASLEQAAEQMSAGHAILDFLHAIPHDFLDEIVRYVFELWHVRVTLKAQAREKVKGAARAIIRQDPRRWTAAAIRNRGGTARQIALIAGPMAGLTTTVRRKHPKGMSPVQVRQYHRRQQARGRVPGRAQQRGKSRELELEFALDVAARQLEAPEPFWTRVTPIPGIGNKEGHEILTRDAMKGLADLKPGDPYNILTGVIRPDRGSRSYWSFPRAAITGLKASAQPSHSLRPTPSSSVAAAMRLIQARFAGLHSRALGAATRREACEWLGEALHLLQDSYSSAHTERAGGTGRIRTIRVFFIRVGWPPRSKAPSEHNAPSDPRDNVYAGGALRPEASAAVRASRAFLIMALRHLKTPRSPRNRTELLAFIRRYLSM
jgi:hypothetical protein